ncbi:MAG: DnaJ domain-containing protein [Deltaproteobacteria bacterium]|nr:DnaJ domain-containing protein [Deltaproteobacteria bacterium]
MSFDAAALLEAVPLIDTKIDLRTLPLDAREGFVLSRIDGSCNVQMLGAVTGMSDDEIIGVVRKLANLKAITFKGMKPPPVAAPPPAPPLQPAALPALPRPVEEVDLSDAEQQKIFDLHNVLGKASHYDILLVTRTAAADEIKTAYYKFSKDFHPDRFYGKKLGSYKAMLEKLFRAGKSAYEVLGDPAARAAYDKTLPKNAAPAAGVGDAEFQKRAALEAHRQKILDERAKKQRAPMQEQLDRAKAFALEGETFFKQGDLVSAVARFALALGYDPANEEYKRRHQELVPVANEVRAKGLAAQAATEATNGNFSGAAGLYLQAFDINPGNGTFAARAADLYEKQGTDHTAALAAIDKAIGRSPKNGDYRLLMATILEKLGELVKAREALKLAQELGCNDEDAKKLLKRLR